MTDEEIEERLFKEEIAARETDIKEDLDTAHELFELVKDSGDETLKKHARWAVELGEEASAKASFLHYHSGWNAISEQLRQEAAEKNTGCRENIRKAKALLAKEDDPA